MSRTVGQLRSIRAKEKFPPRGVSEVFTLDGRKVAENVLISAPLTGERKEKWQLQGFSRGFSYSCSMNIAGRRLYICSQDDLYCIGKQ